VRADLPFACKGGVCGTCRARVTDGSVAMRRNFALEDDELAAGFVLTCQSLPTSDTVTVDYDS
jgi:ring-1,2-phenylacetyl-CoA epoxidase subunit PaaE